jgi:hypothetical protein
VLSVSRGASVVRHRNSRFALLKTSSIIAAVSFPVFVFWRLG